MAATWTAPTAITAIPTLIQLFQCSLLFIPPSFLQPYKITPQQLTYFRAAILPLCIYGIWTCYSHPQHSYFQPARDFMHLNILLQVGKYYGCIKAIEFALCNEKEYTWMGYGWAYRDIEELNHKGIGSSDHDGAAPSLESDTKPVVSEGGHRYGRSTREIVWMAWRCTFSPRGIGWAWGIRGKQIPPLYPARTVLPTLLLRLVYAHATTVLLYAFLQYSREVSPDPSFLLLHVLNIPQDNENTILRTGTQLLSRLLHVFAFGVAIYASVEMDVTLATIIAYFLTNFFRAIIPPKSILAKYLRPDPFNPKAWPTPSNEPLLAESITELWGKRWHALFRRTFVACGTRPMTKMAEKMGLKARSAKVAFGALGAFAISGFIHESINDASPWLPRDAHYKTVTFFLLQVIPLVLEEVFRSFTGPKVGGIYGRVWSWSFMLVTGLLLTECWLERGIVDGTPSLAQWEWWRWTVPGALTIPSFDKPRAYQLQGYRG